ncbi:MAG: NTP transferase domain-containing protein [Trueperaceae bacterium]
MQGSHPQVIAVVLAGGDRHDPLAQTAGVPVKALVPLAGKPMAAYVIAALEQSESVAEIVYVGPGFELLGVKRGRAVEPGKGFANSLALGLGAAQSISRTKPALVVTADIPWLTSAAVDRFVTAGIDAELAYPIVSEEDTLAAFPTHKRTFVRLKQGRFTGGNLMLLKPRLVGSLLDLIDRVYRARKNPLALAVLVGPRTLLALLLGRADLTRLEQLASERLGGVAHAVVSADACLAADVDRLEQLDVPMPVGEPA